MAKTINPTDQVEVGQFVGKVLRGVADLGYKALPFVAKYQAARQSGVSIIDLALEDEDTMRMVVEAIGRRAERLPPPLLKLLERVVADAKQRQEPRLVPVGAYARQDIGNDV